MREREINQYWKRIINTMNDGLMLIGTDGTIVMVNEAFERLTGHTADSVIGRPCTLLSCDTCETALSNETPFWCSLFSKKQEIRNHCHILRKDGTYVPVLKNAAPLTDEGGNLIGAVETLTDLSRLERLDQQVVALSRELERGRTEGFQGIIGESAEMRKLFEVIVKAAQSDAPVIITGESGTGKELVAQAIHKRGRRKEGPFVQLNCAALNESLLESELFGHIKGAFTGAYRHRMGRFEAAHGGDIFLDEIGDLPLSIQVKLLRVLESKTFERVGDHRPVHTDVRIITATHRNLPALIAQKRFREDFYFRINVIPIHLPPLRARQEDIPLLTEAFIRQLRTRTDKPVVGLTRAAMERFMAYSWPGNVRELKSALEYAFVVAEGGSIDTRHLPPSIEGNGPPECAFAEAAPPSGQKQALIAALRQSRGNQTEAARILGISRVTVWNRMKKYGIDLKRVLVQ